MIGNLSRRMELIFWDVATPVLKQSAPVRSLVRAAYQLRSEGFPKRYWGVLALSGLGGFLTGMIFSILLALVN